MKKCILFVVAVYAFTFYACNTHSSPEIPGTPYVPEVYTKTFAVTPALMDSSKLLLIAKGNNPDWFCEFYVYKLIFVYNSGKDSAVIRTDLSYQLTNGILLDPMAIESKKDNIRVEIDPDQQIGEEISDALVKKIVIKMGNKTFAGYVTKAK